MLALVAVLVAAVATAYDVKTGRIPNLLSGCAIGFGLGVQPPLCAFAGIAVAGGICALIEVFALDRDRGDLGGGDWKFLVGLGALLGWRGIVVTSVVAGVGCVLAPPKVARIVAPFILAGVLAYALGGFLC